MLLGLKHWCLRHCASTAEGVGLISGWGTKVPHAVQHDQNRKKKKKCCYNNWILTNSFRAKYVNLELQEAQTQADSAPTQFFYHGPCTSWDDHEKAWTQADLRKAHRWSRYIVPAPRLAARAGEPRQVHLHFRPAGAQGDDQLLRKEQAIDPCHRSTLTGSKSSLLGKDSKASHMRVPALIADKG